MNKKKAEYDILLIEDKLEAPGLRTDELETLHLHNRIRKQADSKIKKDFLTLLNLFKEFGFNEAALDFSELIRNFLEQVRKYFLNETQFDQTMELLESPAQHD